MKLGSLSKKYRCSRKKRPPEFPTYGRTIRKTKTQTQNKLTCDNGAQTCTGLDSRLAVIEASEVAKKTYDAGVLAGCSSDRSEGASLLLQDPEGAKVPQERWHALILFCALAFMQCCVGNTWGPIATSAMLAFPSWQKSDVAILSNWGCIAYLSCCLPSCWFLNRNGLQAPLRMAAVMSTVATFLRCLTSQESIFTVSAHAAAILNGLAGVIIGPSAALLSATWFPRGERTTATGISACFNQLGVAGSYLIGAAVVKAPSICNTSISGENVATTNCTEPSSSMRDQVMSLMRIEFFAHFLILVGFVWFFPAAQPPQQPKSMPCSKHYNIFDSIRYLAQFRIYSNKSVWRLCGAAALSQGVIGPWLAMITMAFASSITQDDADKLAFWTVILGSALGVFASRLMDVFQGYLKIAIFVLLAISSAMFLWVLLLDRHVVSYKKGNLYTAVAFGVSFSWATPALFVELASEIAFPVSEAIVSGYMIFLANIIAAIFYFSYFLPDMSEHWSSYWVFGSLTTALILLLYVKEEYNRTPAIRVSCRR